MIKKNNLKNKWILLFAIVFAMQLIGNILNAENLQIFTKPLLLIVLFLFYFFESKKENETNKFILAALAFSWLGDVLLIFQEEKAILFTLGLTAFLIAHICYTYYFAKILTAKMQTIAFPLYLCVGIYAVCFYFFLLPKLGAMQFPVLIYALTISCMLIATFQVYFKNRSYLLCAIGALLFVLSDSILAINKFYEQFEAASFLIMLTYGLAQLLLVFGILKKIN